MSEFKTNMSLKERARECLGNIPVSINTHYGDPFQPNQWEDTLDKLRYLKSQGYCGEIEVSSKWVITDEQILELSQVNSNLWIFCGITGMNEGGIPMEARIDNYLRLCAKFPNTVLNIRPLIPGINDSMAVLKPIIDVAARGRKLLKHGGFIDTNHAELGKSKYDALKDEIHSYCLKIGVNDGPKCSVIVSDVTRKVDSTHDDLEPINLDVLKAIGYRYAIENGKVRLLGHKNYDGVTKGDVSFARLIIQSSRILPEWSDSHVHLSFRGAKGQYLACTSSWFHWAREVDCMVACPYCHVRPGTPIYLYKGDSGCSPLDLYEMIFERHEKPFECT